MTEVFIRWYFTWFLEPMENQDWPTLWNFVQHRTHTKYIQTAFKSNYAQTILGWFSTNFEFLMLIKYTRWLWPCKTIVLTSNHIIGIYQTSLKIPKGKSESVILRTDNTMTKRKSYDLQILCRKLKIEQQDLTKNRWWTRVLLKGEQFLLQMWPHILFFIYGKPST
jgi:hypothetical protein